MSIQEQVISRIDGNKVVELTRELIKIPSFVGQENDIGQFIYDRMLKISHDVKIIAAEEKRPNVLCRYRGSENEQSLILVGHTDTIYLNDQEKEKWTVDPFEGIVKDNKIYGLGATDMKSAIAAMIIAIEAIADSSVKLLNDTILIFCVDEEKGSTKGMQYLIDQKMIEPKMAVGIQGEPTNMRVQGWFKGWAEYEIITRGKAAHSSKFEEGINAIHGMNDILQSLRGRGLKYKEHPLLGKSTLSIGTIQGGVSAKIVPDSCKSLIEVRMVPGQSTKAVLKEIAHLIEKLRARNPKLAAEIKLIRGKDPAEIPVNSPIVELARSTAKELTGELPDYGREPIAGGDVNLLIRHLQIPSVLFGPGILENAHAPDEFVPVRNVVDISKIYASLILKYCGYCD